MAKKQTKIQLNENDIKAADLPTINSLLGQLVPNFREPDSAYMKKVMNGGIIFTARDGKKLVGMATLVFIRKPTAFVGSCENVVVDENYRGLGIGKKIMKKLLKKSKALKMKYVDLTSNPKREQANLMYHNLGFRKRETNCFRKHL